MIRLRQHARLFFLAVGFVLFVAVTYVSVNKANDVQAVKGQPKIIRLGTSVGATNGFASLSATTFANAGEVQPKAADTNPANESTSTTVKSKSNQPTAKLTDVVPAPSQQSAIKRTNKNSTNVSGKNTNALDD